MKQLNFKFLFSLAVVLSMMVFNRASAQKDTTFQILTDRYMPTFIEAEYFDPTQSFKLGSPSTLPTVATENDTTYVGNLVNDMILTYKVNVGAGGGVFRLVYNHKKIASTGNIRYWIDNAYLNGTTTSATGSQTALPTEATSPWQDLNDTKDVALTEGAHTFAIRVNVSNKHYVNHLILVPKAGSLSNAGTPAALNITAANGAVAQNPDYKGYNIVGDVVELTAVPNFGYKFDGWSGDATGTTNPISVTMDGDKNITANFSVDAAVVTYSLTANATNGSVTKSPDLADYADGAIVELAATPDFGYEFTGWSGDATGTDNPLTVSMDANKTITANFTMLPTYTLTINDAYGVVTKSPDLAQYPEGTEVTITSGQTRTYRFTDWSGDVVSADYQIVVPINANTSITANYEEKLGMQQGDTYYLDAAEYKVDTFQAEWYHPFYSDENLTGDLELVIDTIHETGVIFVTKMGNYSNMGFPVEVGTNGGEFEINYRYKRNSQNNSRVRFSVDMKGISGTSVEGTWSPLTNIPLTADGEWSTFKLPFNLTLSPGSHVVYFSANYSDQHDADYFTLTPANTYTLAVDFNAAQGTVDVAPVKDFYAFGEEVVLSPAGINGFTFTNWSGDYVGVDYPLTLMMDASKVITAGFLDFPTAVKGTSVKLFEVSPNPSTGIFNVIVAKSASYVVYNLAGSVVKSGTVSGSFDLNMSAYTKGIYALQVKSEDGVAVKRIIVK